MRSATALDGVDAAPVGVFAWTRADGTPRSCAVTPYVVDGRVVVTTTLALPTKALAVAHDPHAALLAGGWHVRTADARVTVDTTPAWFDAQLRAAERRKYPPARSLLAVPGHRRLLWWYVGRVIVDFGPDPEVVAAPGLDAVTVTSRSGDGLRIDPLPIAPDDVAIADAIDVGPAPDGPVDVLVHVERRDFCELAQLHRRGPVRAGRLVDPTTTGTLHPPRRGTVAELRELRDLGRLARDRRDRLAALAPVGGR